MDGKLFSKRFDMLYQDSDLSQEDFGEKFGASKNQVYNWRTGLGEPDTETLKAIAEYCKVSVDWLVGNSNVRTPVTVLAANRSDNGTEDLPEEALKQIESFKEFIRSKYLKR